MTVYRSAGDKHNLAGVIGKSKDTVDIEGSPLEKAIYKHQWEHQVFGGRPVPKHIRYNLLVLQHHTVLRCFVISMHNSDHLKGMWSLLGHSQSVLP